MGIKGRIENAEAALPNFFFWQDVLRLAKKTGLSSAALLADVQAMDRRYGHLVVPAPGGKLDVAPALRAIAEGEALDYQELVSETRRELRRMRARQSRTARTRR